MIQLGLFYIAATITIASSLLAITRHNASHALIYLIVSLLGSAIVFYVLGAPFAAVLEVLIYAGAIMVLFVFVIMMLDLGAAGVKNEQQWLKPRTWVIPSLLCLALLAEIIYLLSSSNQALSGVVIGPKAVGIELFGPYVLAVEIASMLLLAGLVGAYHLGRRYLIDMRGESI
jgi:NADH-quinone oxidoreductase subunit J